MSRPPYRIVPLALLGATLFATNANALVFEDQGTAKVTQGCNGSGCWTNYARIADLNGDKKLDLVFVNCDGFFANPTEAQPIIVEYNDGLGNFTDASQTAISGFTGAVRQVALGDIDGDGDIDMFAPDAAVAPNVLDVPDKLFINQGNGVFVDEAATRLGGISSAAGATRFADLDDDGDLDLIIVNGYLGAPGARLFLNDGTGHFTEKASAFPGFTGQPDDVDVADFDGDFDLDVLVNLHQAKDVLWINDGTGQFTDASANLPAPEELNNHYNPGIADIDGDGDLDIVIDNIATNYEEQLLLNDGHAVFTDATSRISGNVTSDDNGAAFLDYDGDGHLDLAIPAFTTSERLFKNDGSGSFTRIANAFSPIQDSTLWIDFGDLNGDGRLDAMTAQGEPDGPEHVYYGTTDVAVDTVAPKIIVQSTTMPTPGADTVVHFRVSDNAVTDDGPRLEKAWIQSGGMEFTAQFMGGDMFRAVVPKGAVADGSTLLACAQDLQGNVPTGCDMPNPTTSSATGTGVTSSSGATGATTGAGASTASSSGAGGGGDGGTSGGCGCRIAADDERPISAALALLAALALFGKRIGTRRPS